MLLGSTTPAASPSTTTFTVTLRAPPFRERVVVAGGMTLGCGGLGVGEISGCWAGIGDGGRSGGVVELGLGDCGEGVSSELAVAIIENS